MNRIQIELLLRKAQSGDTDALDTLIATYYPQILNYCRWHTADEQQAQDAAQETFLKAVRWLDSCDGFQGAFRPFLYKIAKNICIDLNRTMERSEISLESLPGEPAYQESGFAAAEEKANLRALTAQLEPEQRELVLLRFAQQLKLREIAQITGLPLRTVQSRLRAAPPACRIENLENAIGKGGLEMNRAFEKELSRALAAEPDTAVPETLLRRCRAEHVVKQRSDWRDLLHCQFKLLGWKVWALEAMAALALYSVGRELALWEKAWTLRNALFGLSTLAMLTALLGLPFLYRASQYKMLELEQATYAGIGRPLVMRFLLLLAGETILLGVLVLNVRAAVPWSIGQLLAVLTVPFLIANNELLLLLRWVRPEWMITGAVPLFAGQLCLLRFVQLSELPKGLPLAAGVLVLCMVLQCIRLAARSEYIAEA